MPFLAPERSQLAPNPNPAPAQERSELTIPERFAEAERVLTKGVNAFAVQLGVLAKLYSANVQRNSEVEGELNRSWDERILERFNGVDEGRRSEHAGYQNQIEADLALYRMAQQAFPQIKQDLTSLHNLRTSYEQSVKGGRLIDAQRELDQLKIVGLRLCDALDRFSPRSEQDHAMAGLWWANRHSEDAVNAMNNGMIASQLVRDGATAIGVSLATAGAGTAASAAGYGRLAAMLISTAAGTGYGTAVTAVGSGLARTYEFQTGNLSLNQAWNAFLSDTGTGAVQSFTTALSTAAGAGLTSAMLSNEGVASFRALATAGAAGNMLSTGVDTAANIIQALQRKDPNGANSAFYNGLKALPFAGITGVLGVNVHNEGGNKILRAFTSPAGRSFATAFAGIVQSYVIQGRLTPEAAANQVFNSLADLAQGHIATNQHVDPKLLNLAVKVRYATHPFGYENIARVAGSPDAPDYVNRVRSLVATMDSYEFSQLASNPNMSGNQTLRTMTLGLLESKVKNPNENSMSACLALNDNHDLRLALNDLASKRLLRADVAQKVLLDPMKLDSIQRALQRHDSPAMAALARRGLEVGEGSPATFSLIPRLLRNPELCAQVDAYVKDDPNGAKLKEVLVAERDGRIGEFFAARPQQEKPIHEQPSQQQPGVPAQHPSENANTQRIFSEALQRDLQNPNTQGIRKPLTDADFSMLKYRVLSSMPNLPYHNREHVELVMHRVEEAARACGRTEREVTLLKLAAMYHDYDHAGNTYRQDVPGADRNDLTNEEYAAIAADNDLKDYLTVDERVTLQGLILATSFGQNQNALDAAFKGAQRPELVRPYSATTDLENILALADVSNFDLTFDSWLKDNYNVVTETPVSRRPESFDEFLRQRTGFLGYVQMRLDAVKELMMPSVYDASCAKLTEFKSLIEQLKTQEEARASNGKTYRRSDIERDYNRAIR